MFWSFVLPSRLFHNRNHFIAVRFNLLLLPILDVHDLALVEVDLEGVALECVRERDPAELHRERVGRGAARQWPLVSAPAGGRGGWGGVTDSRWKRFRLGQLAGAGRSRRVGVAAQIAFGAKDGGSQLGRAPYLDFAGGLFQLLL